MLVQKTRRFVLSLLYVENSPADKKKNLPLLHKTIHRIYQAVDLESGLVALRQYHPHIILIGRKTETFHGIDFLKEARELGFNPRVILLVDTSDCEFLKLAFQNNVDYYLDVPYTEKRITEVLEKAKDAVLFEKHYQEQSEVIQRLSCAVEQSPSAVIITDRYGKIEYVNPKFINLTGYTEDEAMGKQTNILKSGLTPAETYKSLWTTVTSGKDWRGDFINRKKNGELYWERAYIAPVKNDNGIITHFVSVKEDITEDKKAEEALRLQDRELRRRNEIMEQDLKNAQLIQKAFLPQQIPVIDQLKIDYRYYPLETIGGDYFSFTQFREGGMGVFLGDVTGHGVSAALFLSLVKAFSDRVCRQYGQSPKEFLKKLNMDLIDNMTTHFLTAIYGHFKFQLLKQEVIFTFSQGGHPSPIVWRKDRQDIEVLSTMGSILGVMENIFFNEAQVELRRGDRLYIFTDGILESMNEEGEILGVENLCKVIRSSNQQHLSDTMDAIMDGVKEHRGKAAINDDMVMIGFEVK